MRPVVEAQIRQKIALRLRYRSAQGGGNPYPSLTLIYIRNMSS